jgi:hypothetical protein
VVCTTKVRLPAETDPCYDAVLLLKEEAV